MQMSSSLCDPEEPISYREFEEEYHNFIMGHTRFIQEQMTSTRTHLTRHFGITMADVIEAMNINGGYSLHSNPYPTGALNNCELLFLRMEDGPKWKDIFSTLYPGIKYHPNRPRTDACPKIAEYYKAIERRGFTEEEMESMIQGNSDVAAYFQMYNLL